MYKTIISSFMILHLVILSGCTKQESTISNVPQQESLIQEDAFAMKEKCFKYKESALDYIDEKFAVEKDKEEGLFGSATLGEIFYSPLKNSCMFSYDFLVAKGEYYNKGKGVIDVLSNRVYHDCEFMQLSDEYPGDTDKYNNCQIDLMRYIRELKGEIPSSI